MRVSVSAPLEPYIGRALPRQDSPLPEYKNPNQAGGASSDNRSFLVMMIVMIGVIAGLQLWRAKHNPETASPSNTAAVSQPASTQQTTTPPSTVATPAAAAATPAVQAAAEQTTVVENNLYRITFSNQGANVRSWILKKYTDNDGKPLDLVHDGASKLFGYPLSLYTYDKALTQTLDTALYVPSATGTLAAPATLTFQYASGDLKVTKTFSFGHDYVLHADTEVMRNGAPVAAALAWPAALGDMENATAYAQGSIDLSQNGRDEHLSLKKVSGGSTLNGPVDFAGVSDQYFGAIFLPDHADDATVVTFSNKIDVNKVARHGGGGVASSSSKPIELPALGAAIGSRTGHVQTRLFVGPKDWQVLGGLTATTGASLRSVVDFGFWGPIGKFLFLGLRMVHGWIAPSVATAKDYSWGWAIVLFTVLIYVILLPLRIQSMKGMLKMQRIQPEIDRIKAKHGNPGATSPKAAEMNAEIMAYQKKQGVSMFGGCIPTLIQFPLLFAFYTMMTKVVELRHAHFFWLPDLSQADPWHILPIFMVVTMFLVQWYTPSPGVDPAQARMMAFMMPAVSGYWTWSYASGLALYWAVGNIIMIAQQMGMNRTAMGREMRDIQALRAKRNTVKAAGSPRTIQGRR